MAEIAEDVRTVLTSYSTDEVRVTVRDDPLARGLSVMVILPRDRFSGDVRKEIEAALVEAFEGEVLNYHLALGEGDQARLHFHLAAAEHRREGVDPADLERAVSQLIRTWTDLVEEGLGRAHPGEAARSLAREYGAALSLEYQAATDPEVAVGDIGELEAMRVEKRTISVSLANRDQPVAGIEGATELKLFLRGERLVLSDFMPILDNLGLRVIAMKPYEVRSGDDTVATIYVFAVQDGAGHKLDIEARGELLSETLLAARSGDAVSDVLNALVVSAGLHWREVDVLRGLSAYAFQVGSVPSRLALPSALVKYPGIAKELFDLFATKFDPTTAASVDQRLNAVADIRTAFQASLRSVALLADDRALRRLEELISCAVRTNYYRRGGRTPTSRSGGAPFISYKLLVGDLEQSRPTELLFEVWVHSARMEGVHLRGSTVARGGIRWSDRPDDFRKEVLGLVRTQMVKNAVIVPGGSKGGFITRRTPSEPERAGRGRPAAIPDAHAWPARPDRQRAGRQDRAAAGRRRLRSTGSLPRGGGRQRHGDLLRPRQRRGRRVRLLAGRRVRLGRLARIRPQGDRHHGEGCVGVREAALPARSGKDIQTEPFTVAGIGDMSGDVFGNGMLLSEQIRLVAAFDHRHVFIDPDPDPAVSFAERERMFGLGRSSWDDYDRSRLSKGGMIVPRGAKEVDLTPEARKRVLGIPEGEAPTDGEALDPLRSARARRAALERRDRHVREGEHRDPRRRGRPREQRGARRRDRAALRGRGRGRKPGLHAACARRVRPRGWQDQHRRARQLGRRRHVGPRGEPQDPHGARRGRRHDVDGARNQVLEELSEPVAELVLQNNRIAEPGDLPGRDRGPRSRPTTSGTSCSRWRSRAISTVASRACRPATCWRSGARRASRSSGPSSASFWRTRSWASRPSS